MKKLIIGAVAICAAFIAQAATVNWGVGSTQIKCGGEVAKGATAELYLLGVGLDAGKYELWDTRTVSSFGAGGGLSNNKSAAQTKSGYNGTYLGGGFWNADAGDLGREYYMVLTYTTEGGDTYTYTTTAKASTGLTSALLGTVQFDFADTTTTVAGTKDAWVLQSVPEPTSGLLLLLGVAGLALCRRRA